METSVTFVLLAILIAAGLYKAITYVLSVEQAFKEPPFIPQTIPFIGHLLGIVRYGTKYYSRVSAKYPLPAYSLGMPLGRMYIVNSPDLVVAVQRNSKSLNPAPFTVKFAAKIFDLSKETEEIWLRNVGGEEGDWGYHIDGMKYIHKALASGKADLDNLNDTMLQNMVNCLDRLDQRNSEEQLLLMQWLRHEITVASTGALYGTHNPLKSRVVEDGFWDFYNNFTMLLLNILPSFVASKGFEGRKKVFEAFQEYFRIGGQKHASALVKARYTVGVQYNVVEKDIAHFEIGNVVAALVNVTPTSFWTIWHVYSDFSVLKSLRAEVLQALSTTVNENGTFSSLNVSKLMTDCPLLISTFQEVLRVRSTNASVRLVMEDTLLDNRYLLKKGTLLHMPSQVIHSDESVWGHKAREFQAQRFIDQKIHAGAFRGFGGGTNLCPGRHFATISIVSFVAMFVLRYDLRPVAGKWIEPTQNIINHVASVLFPDQDTAVRVSARKEYANRTWPFTSVESGSRSNVSVVE